MLDEKEKERLEKICPVELDLPVFLSLAQTAVSVGEEVYSHEEIVGMNCHWCPATSVDSEIEYEDQKHDKFCPIRLSREYLYRLGIPLKKIRIVGLAEIKSKSRGNFLRTVDEIIYRVGEIEEIETFNGFVEKLLKARHAYLEDAKYTMRFMQLEELQEYRS